MARSAAVDANNGLARCNHGRSLPCMRVVAGDLRGRRIEAPISEATRPTTDKVRQAVFNALGSLDIVEGARVLDLFAGTGAMGIEALSRGAGHCVFVERDRDALVILKKNIAVLGLTDRTTVLAVDATSVASRQPDIDILIADPSRQESLKLLFCSCFSFFNPNGNKSFSEKRLFFFQKCF